MKCCASPTTSIAVDQPRPDAHEAAAAFEALLWRVAFKPIGAAMGFYGDIVVDAATRSIAQTQHGGLTRLVERLLAAGARAGDDSG